MALGAPLSVTWSSVTRAFRAAARYTAAGRAASASCEPSRGISRCWNIALAPNKRRVEKIEIQSDNQGSGRDCQQRLAATVHQRAHNIGPARKQDERNDGEGQ